jgi:putative DNA primase/helicase
MNSISINTYETIQNNAPNDLALLAQWVAWSGTIGNNGKTVKIPINPKSGKPAKTNDRETWGTFDEALSFSRQHNLPGVGFVFSETDEFAGIDLDHCIDPDTGDINDEAKKIVDRLDSYAEISPSGRGLHIFVRGKLPEGPRRNGKVEMYDSKRFFTVTGNILDGVPPSVMDRNAQLLELYHELLVPPSAKIEKPPNPVAIDDLVLIQTAKTHGNGDKFSRLWSGDFLGYPSQSEADLALCRSLAFWTNCDAGKIDRLFRQSGLYRLKWDELHFASGKTYGQATIAKAILTADEGYAQPGKSPNRAAHQREFHLTDLGNAERLVHHFGDRVRYCHAWKKWIIWDGVRWTVDQTDQIRRFAKLVIRKIYGETEAASDPNKRHALAKHAMSSESDKRIKAMISLAQDEVPIRPEDLDRNPWLLTCLNGTVDLKTGMLLPHRRGHFITKLAPVHYEKGAPCPGWLAFLDQIMDGNESLIQFLQRAIG